MAAADRVWSRVEQLTDRAPTVADLRAHRLELVAAQRLRARGDRVPAELRADERIAAATALAAPVVLSRIRAAYDGRLILMKGPELALRYPDPALRPFLDLDLLADDPAAAHRALRDAGFALAGRWGPQVRLHHLQPLCWPGLPLGVELHSRPKFPGGLRAPPTSELMTVAGRARFHGGEVDTLAPAAHALMTAAHAWAHAPLACIGQLADVALLADEADPAQIDALARRWGCTRMWHATRDATTILFTGGRPTAALRLWARHLAGARERTLFERHLEEMTSPLWGLPAHRATAEIARVLSRRVLPAAEETWSHKLRHVRRAAGHAGLRQSDHEAQLPPEDLTIGAPQGLQAASIPDRPTAP